MFENKKRLKQFEKSLRISNEVLEAQGTNGNYNYDQYMTGLYNGMEMIVSLMEVRAPMFVSGKWINYKKHEDIDAKDLIAREEIKEPN